MKIGEKVVCVNDSPCVFCGAKVSIIKNQIYIVVGIRLATLTQNPILDLLGIKPNCHVATEPKGFGAHRFRMLDEMKLEAKQRQRQMA